MNSSKKILFLSIAFFVILGSFAQDIPQNIKSTITKNHFRIPGTKLFITKPASFSYIKDINVLKYDDSTFIHCIYIPDNFLMFLKKNNFDFIYNKDYEIVTKQRFKHNGMQGIYYKLKEGNSYWLYFSFGDSLAENRIFASYPIGSTMQDTILNFMKNSFYKTNFKLNPLENAKYEIDLNSIGFEFTTFTLNQFVYTEIQTKNKKVNGDKKNLISIIQLQPAKDIIDLQQTANIMLQQYQNQGIIINQIINSQVILIDSNWAYKVILACEIEKKEAIVYLVITSNDEIQIQFTAILNHDGKKLIPIFDKKIGELKIKKENKWLQKY